MKNILLNKEKKIFEQDAMLLFRELCKIMKKSFRSKFFFEKESPNKIKKNE